MNTILGGESIEHRAYKLLEAEKLVNQGYRVETEKKLVNPMKLKTQRYYRVKFPDPIIKVKDQPIEPLIDGVTIIPLGIMCGHILVTNDLSKIVLIEGMSVAEIKAILGDHQSVKALFEHLEWLKGRKIPVSFIEKPTEEFST